MALHDWLEMHTGQGSAMRGVITILVENTSRKRGLKGEHGISMFIEVDDRAFLFDTGQTDLILKNAIELGVDLSRAESIVLSHNHYDHTGGLIPVLDTLREPPPVICHPDVFIGHFACRDGLARSIGMGFSRDDLEKRGVRLKLGNGPQEVIPGVTTTGEIPRLTEYEDVGGNYFNDEACTVPDLIRDDQAVIIDSPEGLVICCGCAHSGVVNTVRYVQGLTGGKPIDTIIGGMHLVRASEYRIAETVKVMKEIGVRRVYAGHCTGQRACGHFEQELPGVFTLLEVGLSIEFGT